MATLQGGPISIILPQSNPDVINKENEAARKVVDVAASFDSGKVVEDYVSDNIIKPLRDSVIELSLLYAGAAFVIVGLILLALKTNTGSKLASKGVSAASGGVL